MKTYKNRTKFAIEEVCVRTKWHNIGTAQGLTTDTQIASFLIEQYEHSHQASPCCDRCYSTLTLFCTACQLPGQRTQNACITSTDSQLPVSTSVCALGRDVGSLDRRSSLPSESDPAVKLAPRIKLEPQVGHSKFSDDAEDVGDDDNVEDHESTNSGFLETINYDDDDSTISDIKTCDGEGKRRTASQTVKGNNTCDFNPFVHIARASANSPGGFMRKGVDHENAYDKIPPTSDFIKTEGADCQADSMSGVDINFPLGGSLNPLVHAATHTVNNTGDCRRKRVRRSLATQQSSKRKENTETTRSNKSKVRFLCSICDLEFSNWKAVGKHKLTQHPGERPFQCKVCSSAFKKKKHLQYHMVIHTGEKPFVCDDCGKGFAFSHTLKVHMRVHMKEKPFVCQTCGAGYIQKGGLRQHERTHTGEKPYVCEVCCKAFSDVGCLTSHKLTHMEERPFTCEFCGVKLKSKKCLKTHTMRVHTGVHPKGIIFPCPECEFTTHVSQRLRQHMLTHSEERPFQCLFCSKAFRRKFHLQRHQQCHMGAQAFSCNICKATYNQIDNLKAHMKRHNQVKTGQS